MKKLIFLILLMLFNYTVHSFEDSQCLKGDFETSVNKAIDPFGYFYKTLNVKKENCNVTIEIIKAKYLNSKWQIDICREPIHIKFGKNLQNVVRKNQNGCDNNKNEYCQTYREIKEILENNGLIYGEGIRENLSSQHGMIYCSYLLINQYLNNNIIFSYEKPLEIILDGPTFMQELSEKKGQNIAPIKIHQDKFIPSSENEETLYNF